MSEITLEYDKAKVNPRFLTYIDSVFGSEDQYKEHITKLIEVSRKLKRTMDMQILQKQLLVAGLDIPEEYVEYDNYVYDSLMAFIMNVDLSRKFLYFGFAACVSYDVFDEYLNEYADRDTVREKYIKQYRHQIENEHTNEIKKMEELITKIESFIEQTNADKNLSFQDKAMRLKKLTTDKFALASEVETMKNIIKNIDSLTEKFDETHTKIHTNTDLLDYVASGVQTYVDLIQKLPFQSIKALDEDITESKVFVTYSPIIDRIDEVLSMIAEKMSDDQFVEIHKKITTASQ